MDTHFICSEDTRAEDWLGITQLAWDHGRERISACHHCIGKGHLSLCCSDVLDLDGGILTSCKRK